MKSTIMLSELLDLNTVGNMGDDVSTQLNKIYRNI